MDKSHDQPKQPSPCDTYVLRHLRIGWWCILIFLILGTTLELFHGFKIMWYLDAANETRRLMWTLAHAHGVLLGLVNIALAATWAMMPEVGVSRRGLVSTTMIAATVLLPGGFFLGGLFIYGGDPGIGIFIAPLGALALCISVAVVAMSLVKRARP